MATPQDNDEWISEEELARSLGVKRSDLRDQRPSLKNGGAQMRGNMVFWLKKTALSAATKLGLSGDNIFKKTALSTDEDTAPASGELLTVFSMPGPSGHHFSNKNLIKAKRASGEVVVVRVVDSAKYRPVGRNGLPMQFRAVPAEGQWWRLAGREPRFVGAW